MQVLQVNRLGEVNVKGIFVGPQVALTALAISEGIC